MNNRLLKGLERVYAFFCNFCSIRFGLLHKCHQNKKSYSFFSLYDVNKNLTDSHMKTGTYEDKFILRG